MALPLRQPQVAAFDNGSVTTNVASYATNSVTFVAGRLYVLCVIDNAASPLDPTSVKMTVNTTAWTKVAAGITLSTGNMTLWAIRGFALTDTVTIDYNAVAQTGQEWIIFELTGWYDDGTILDAFVQSGSATGTSATSSVTLPSAPQASSRVLCFAGNGLNVALTADANFTKLTETVGHGTPNSRSAGEVDNGIPQQTATFTFTSTGWLTWGLEVRGLGPRTAYVGQQAVNRAAVW